MQSTAKYLLEKLADPTLKEAGIIEWASPIPSFGSLNNAKVATLGLNPSNREFMAADGRELDGPQRRFHTLRSLGLKKWSDADARHLNKILSSCELYFSNAPYDTWFGQLEKLLSGCGVSYYCAEKPACHLDLIPFATSQKWTQLSVKQRTSLLDHSAETLGRIVRDSSLSALVLNGRTVVETLERFANVTLSRKVMAGWTLPRKSGKGISGIAFTGSVGKISGVALGREVRVLGYNHNIQSSFGVTKEVKRSIRKWLAKQLKEELE